MGIDFERDYGVNAGYVQALYEEWQSDPESVDESWRRLFDRADPRIEKAPSTPGAAAEGAPRRATTETAERPAAPAPAATEATRPEEPADELELLSGISRKIVENMTQSLELPTASSIRNVPAKLLDENRRILNEHMQVRALGKASFTHLIAYALVRALSENRRVASSFVEQDGKRYRKISAHINLGLAIDVPGPNGRMLVVPNIRRADSLGFAEFYGAYEELVRRGREGELEAADFKDTTATLTNPGGFGTTMSAPRLMKGQGLIVATGSIAVPPELAGMSKATLSGLAVGKVMTVTSTYDHRVIQGAESGLMLKRLDALLQGADGFYDEIFAAMRVPWSAHQAGADLRDSDGADAAEMQANAWMMINAYRVRGCRLADLDPLEYTPDPLPSLDPASYGFTVWDLDRTFLCGGMGGVQEMTLREILATLRRAYCRRWTIEYMHIVDRSRKHWLRDRVELPENQSEFDHDHRLRILKLLSRAENFERFLHTRYVGNKRFSLEGADTLIPTLAEIIERAAGKGVVKVVIGMAHRGRLNVLANILSKSHEQIFSEFEGVMLPLSSEGSGDVKYHLGQKGSYTTVDGKSVEVYLCANPSHLEAVDPVVCGITRACQDNLEDAERRKVLAVLVHGDAAFSGQGVVAETFNMSGLRAYSNGGTIHLVVNNQIGFTASPRDLRSTYYCTDVAKSVMAPILHANGDYPESVLRAAHVAVDFQHEFGGDAVIDMVCYRRWGHNEGDEPAYTQPVLYSKIRKHPTVRENYTQLLIRRGALTREKADQFGHHFDEELRGALGNYQAQPREELPMVEVLDLDLDEPVDYVQQSSPETGVAEEELVRIIDESNQIPQGHVTHPNLLRQLRRREKMVRGDQDLDWGCAEAVAMGSLVRQGVSIRLSGQDSGRGTFSHRHSVIRDQVSERDYVPLSKLAAEGARFEAWDSLLSEEAVLAFEYGYSLARPETLVIWEAQFGDFVNGAQIPIDQFITSGQAKWKQASGLVLLLPHGFDGQGPEHSSARPERFLAACTGGNLTVANCTSSAQYFHLLRRQALEQDKKPLVVFTPKSLLRDKHAASPIADLAAGRFRELIPDEETDASSVKRVVLCSGKVYYDLADHRRDQQVEHVAVLRLEQLYPFPRQELLAELGRYGDAELVWAQEEPRNMGPWSFMLQRFVDLGRPIEYAGRPESASPATGSYRRHQAEQAYVVRRAFGEI